MRPFGLALFAFSGDEHQTGSDEPSQKTAQTQVKGQSCSFCFLRFGFALFKLAQFFPSA